MVPVTARRGGALLEVVAALPLIALVLAVATALLLTQSRVTLTTSARTEASATLAHASHVLAHDVRPLAGRDLIAWTDSSLYADVPVLVAVSCGAPAPNVIDVVTSPGALIRGGRRSRSLVTRYAGPRPIPARSAIAGPTRCAYP
jgi:hypothetical protein